MRHLLRHFQDPSLKLDGMRRSDGSGRQRVELRKGIGNLMPRCLVGDENMAQRPGPGIVVEHAEREPQDAGL